MANLVFIGDSVTDCDRRGAHAPLGDGYVCLLRAATGSDRGDLTWINRGVSGDTVRDLTVRWQRDAIDPEPAVLSVMIGINDVWRRFDGRPWDAVPLDEFEVTLRQLLTWAVAATGARLVLADPYVIEPDRADPHRAESERFATAVGRLAREFGAVHVRTQAAFDRALRRMPPEALSGDRIHPTPAGHRVIADEFLAALGGRWV